MAAKGSRAGDPNDASSSKLSKQSNQCEGVTKDDPPRRCESPPKKGLKHCRWHVGQAGNDPKPPLLKPTLNGCVVLVKAPEGLRYCKLNEDGPGRECCWRHIKKVVHKEEVKPSPPVYEVIAVPVISEPEPSVVDEIVDLETWIPQDLSRAIRKKIREKLEKSRPKTEDPGYVYAFEIIDPDTPDEIHIKVGYSKDVARRLREWRRQCASKKIVFRGCWPGDVESDKFYGQDGKLIGTIVPAKPTNYPRLIERLVHLELKEVAAKSLHLPLELRGPVKGMSQEPCLDCGKQHKEIFSFKRATTGQLKGNEFECVVLPVIIYWGVFVSKYFGDGPLALY